jgi:HEAT repeat protein
MRYAAINALTSLRWTRANSMAIMNYYRVLADYQDSIVSKARLIEAVECLGAVGNSEAALVLGLQLGLINARTARTGIFDDEITLAIVQALGRIGDNAAFDHLLFTSNLSYSEIIKSAATDAINRLKW